MLFIKVLRSFFTKFVKPKPKHEEEQTINKFAGSIKPAHKTPESKTGPKTKIRKSLDSKPIVKNFLAKNINYRKKASEFAKKRHECFQLSQEAFRQGNKEKAHTLSLEGKKWGEKMEEMNQKAALAILTIQKSEKTGIIDLHGLFVREAETAVHKFLDYHQSHLEKNYLEIITGAGNNSIKKHHPVIRPAIAKILRQRNFRHELVNKDGAFLVTLKKVKTSRVE